MLSWVVRWRCWEHHLKVSGALTLLTSAFSEVWPRKLQLLCPLWAYSVSHHRLCWALLQCPLQSARQLLAISRALGRLLPVHLALSFLSLHKECMHGFHACICGLNPEPWSFVGTDERGLLAKTLPELPLPPQCVLIFLTTVTETRTGWFIWVPIFTAVIPLCGMMENYGAVVEQSSSHHRRGGGWGEGRLISSAETQPRHSLCQCPVMLPASMASRAWWLFTGAGWGPFFSLMNHSFIK